MCKKNIFLDITSISLLEVEKIEQPSTQGKVILPESAPFVFKDPWNLNFR
jgi:hypothetical protein